MRSQGCQRRASVLICLSGGAGRPAVLHHNDAAGTWRCPPFDGSSNAKKQDACYLLGLSWSFRPDDLRPKAHFMFDRRSTSA
jgi:hypothetical protein